MNKRIVCALFAASMMASAALAGCSGDQSFASAPASSAAPAEQSSQQSEAPHADATLGKLSAVKIGSVKLDTDDVEYTGSGYIYQISGKYGVISLDGSKDTGAKYAAAKVVVGANSNLGYIVVSEASGDSKNINTWGMVDKNGNDVLPCKYAAIQMLNDRYAEVVTVDKETKDKDTAVISFSDEDFSLDPNEGDTMYTGKWEVFDVTTKQLVKNASGTNSKTVMARGQFISFIKEDGGGVTLDANGQPVGDEKQFFSDGSYRLEKDGKGEVYTTDGQLLFTYDTNAYWVSDINEPYYVAIKKDENYNHSSWVLFDKQGNIVSKDFSEPLLFVTPAFVLTDRKIYKLDGTQLFPDEFLTLEVDERYGDAYSASGEDLTVIFDKNGTVLFEHRGDGSDDGIFSNKFFAYKSGIGQYNFSTKAFDIDGVVASDWFVSQSNGQTEDLIQTRTGEKIIDSSYGEFNVVEDKLEKVQYIIALNPVNDSVSKGNFDIYRIDYSE